MLFPRKHHERVIGGSTGKEDGESKTYQASHLDAQTVTLNSQSDTNLLGSQVKGNTVNANVGGKLNIESLQDEERFKTKSSGGGLEVEFGFGNNWSVSGYGNASKGTTHRKQVNEQAGIFAEEGGYHIDAENVHLKGGAIASSNAKNSILQTNTLTFEDIQNESSSSAASASISGSLKESKEKWVDNETGRAVKPNTENSTKLDSQRSGGISPGLPMFERDSDSSVTRATLTEGTVILNKDTSPTQTTAAQLGINTDLAQANNQVAQTKDVKAQIQEQQQIASAINNVKSAVETYTANQQEAAEQEVRRLKSRLEKAKQQGNQEAVNQLKKDILQAEIQAENWGTGGSTKRAVDAITHAGLIALSGGSSQSIATAAASSYVNQLIKKATEDYPALNIPTHILWGAVEAELMGGKASTGAISTAAGELGAKYLTEHLYNKKAKDLTETERSQVKEIAKALAGVAGGLAAAGQGSSAVKILSESSIGTTVANNAVEHNAITPETAWDVVNLTIGGASLAYNIEEGNYGMAALDGVGLIYDGFATAVPFLPAGASAGLKAYRASNSVKQSVAIGSDVAKTANAAHQAAKNSQNLVGNARAVGSKIHRDTGRRIGEVSGKPSKLSNNANSYFISANKATGKQPDLSWKGTNTWGDLTTSGQWNAHVKKYESRFGSTSIPIIYERGKGVVNYNPIRPFAGASISAPTTIINSNNSKKEDK